MSKLLEGLRGAIEILTPGWTYFTVENEITSTFFALLLLMLFLGFIIHRLLNRNNDG